MKKSYWIALAIFLLVSAWMLTGQFGDGGSQAEKADVAASRPQLTRVRVEDSRAVEIQREVIIHGNTAPERSVELRAETAGRVAAVPVARGVQVSAGQELVRLDPAQRPARLAEARALLHQRELEDAAAQRLFKQGLKSDTERAAAAALFDSARAAVAAAELDLARTRLQAPFAGVLEERPVEVGSYVSVGDTLARVVDIDPLKVVGQVSEREVGWLELGMRGQVELVGGEQLEGTVRYIGATADEATRTFRVELEVPNPQGRALAGITAQARVEVERLLAHRVSPSVLALDDGGTLGVKSVDADGTVRFHPAQIVRADPDGLWLGGLPEELRLITIGQGFVRAGDRVEAVSQ